MSDQQKYRWPTVIVSATTVVLACFSIWWIFAAYADYRSKDFTLVSEGPIAVKSCLSAASEKQLTESKLDQTGWTCNTDTKEGLGNLLLASVHGMYQTSATLSGEALNTYNAIVMCVQGDVSCQGYSITRAAAYEALSAATTPAATSCDAIYPGQSEGAASAAVAPTITCDVVAPVTSVPVTPAPDVAKLYQHCMESFQYGRSMPTTGTMTIPLAGNEAKPVLLPVLATNSTTDPANRARVLVGTRWGYAAPFYVVLMLATSFFIMDGTVLLLAELTRVDACTHN